jgi:hypothetical protein
MSFSIDLISKPFPKQYFCFSVCIFNIKESLDQLEQLNDKWIRSIDKYSFNPLKPISGVIIYPNAWIVKIFLQQYTTSNWLDENNNFFYSTSSNILRWKDNKIRFFEHDHFKVFSLWPSRILKGFGFELTNTEKQSLALFSDTVELLVFLLIQL